MLAFLIAAQLCAPYPLVLMVTAEAQAADVDPYLACAVVTMESQWNPRAINRHQYGKDGGLFQLYDGAHPWIMDPRENARYALKFLRGLLDKYPEREAIGRYRAGYRWREYQDYVDAVLGLRDKLQGGERW